MAITNNGTKVSLSSKLLPVGFVLPVVVEFDAETNQKKTLTVLKATVEDADPLVTLQNILDDAAIGITKQATDIVTADFIAANDVEIYTELLSISNNVQANLDSDFYGNVAESYICEVAIRIRTL